MFAARSRPVVAFLGLALFLLASCATPPPPARVTPLPNPAAPGSAEPNLTVGADGKLYLSWIEPAVPAGHALRFAVWDGQAWSAARTIAGGDDWFVNWADFPSLAVAADGTLAAHWLRQQAAGGYAYDVWVSTSRDGGATWSGARRVNDDDTATEHGFVTLVPETASGFRLLWLDGRELAAAEPGAMTLRSATLSADGAIGPATVLDERVCDCCATDAVLDGEGAVVAVYRDRSGDEIRDIASVRLEADAWSAPRPVHDDGWHIAGCPVNGPATARAGAMLAVAWFTAAEERPTVRLAFSADGGRSFSAPLTVDDGRPLGRVDVIVLDDGSALVSWLELHGERAEIRLRKLSGTTRSASLTIEGLENSRASGFPRLALLDGRVFLAWTRAGDPATIHTAAVELP